MSNILDILKAMEPDANTGEVKPQKAKAAKPKAKAKAKPEKSENSGFEKSALDFKSSRVILFDKVLHETPKARLFHTADDMQFWLPKRVIKLQSDTGVYVPRDFKVKITPYKPFKKVKK